MKSWVIQHLHFTNVALRLNQLTKDKWRYRTPGCRALLFIGYPSGGPQLNYPCPLSLLLLMHLTLKYSSKINPNCRIYGHSKRCPSMPIQIPTAQEPGHSLPAQQHLQWGHNLLNFLFLDPFTSLPVAQVAHQTTLIATSLRRLSRNL